MPSDLTGISGKIADGTLTDRVASPLLLEGSELYRAEAKVQETLIRLKEAAAKDDVNLMPPIIEAARVHASEGEIIDALQDVFGHYTEAPVF